MPIDSPVIVLFLREALDCGPGESLGDGSYGAIAIFLGVVRNEKRSDGVALTALEYTAYEEMALRQLSDIGAECCARFKLSRVEIAHRLGHVPIGQAAVVVRTAAERRGPALDACREIMERIKADVPIFKREIWADGAASWVAGVDRP